MFKDIFEKTDTVIFEDITKELAEIAKKTKYHYNGVKMVYDLVVKGYSKSQVASILSKTSGANRSVYQMVDDLYDEVKEVADRVSEAVGVELEPFLDYKGERVGEGDIVELAPTSDYYNDFMGEKFIISGFEERLRDGDWKAFLVMADERTFTLWEEPQRLIKV